MAKRLVADDIIIPLSENGGHIRLIQPQLRPNPPSELFVGPRDFRDLHRRVVPLSSVIPFTRTTGRASIPFNIIPFRLHVTYNPRALIMVMRCFPRSTAICTILAQKSQASRRMH